ncbi:MAG: YihY/virulence factor BrkB family protein [Alphaproteobacteria bacterium]
MRRHVTMVYRVLRMILPGAIRRTLDANAPFLAGGVAFFALLSLFPSLALFVACYGLLADANTVERQLTPIADLIPFEAWVLLRAELKAIVSHSPKTLSIQVVVALTIALWSAARGAKSLITALNRVYGCKESRGWIRLNALALSMTLGSIFIFAIAMLTVVAVPVALNFLHPYIGFGGESLFIVNSLRWPILGVAVWVALAAVYRYGPCREVPLRRWSYLGSAVAMSLCLLASIGFSLYVANFGAYDKTYGSLAAVVVLMVWFWVTILAVLIGAAFNAEVRSHSVQALLENPWNQRSESVSS